MRQTTGIIILEGLTGLVLLIGLIFGLIAWRLVSGPTDLEFVRGDIEAAIESTRGGKQVDIERVSLRWQQDTNEFEIFAQGLTFYDAEHALVARADSAIIEINAIRLIYGDVSLSELHVRSGEFTFRRDMNGAIWIAGEEVPAVRPVQVYEAVSPIQYAEQTLLNVVENVSASAAVADIDEITLSEFRVVLIDEPLGIDWWLEGADLSLSREDSVISVSSSGQAFGNGAPERVDFDLEFNPGLREFRTDTNLYGANLFNLPFLAGATEGYSGNVFADLSVAFEVRQTGIEVLSANIVTDSGEVGVGDNSLSIGENDIVFSYNLDENSAEIDARILDVASISGEAVLQIEDFNDFIEAPLQVPHRITLQSSDLRMDFQPHFPGVWRIQNVDAVADLDINRRQLDVERLTASVGNAGVRAQGRLYLADEDAPEGDLPFGVALTASTSGILSPEDVLLFWPFSLGDDARNWVEENVLAGDLSEAVFRMDLRPDSLRDEKLEDEDLQLDFAFDNAQTSFLEDLPPVIDGRGTARLNGNSFSLDLERGSFSNWSLLSGHVSIPQFKPKGELFFIEAEGTGDVHDILQTLSDSRLQLENQYGLKIDDISGTGRATFTLQRPALSEVSYEDTVFSVQGRIYDGAFNNLFREMSLTGGQADILVNNNLLQISGYGRFEDAPIEFTWSDRFRDEGSPDRSRLLASGFVSPDFINRFGVAARTYMSGSAYAEIEALGPSADDFEHVDISLDFQETRLDVAEFDWTKREGENARAEIALNSTGEEQVTSVRFEADGVRFGGDVSLTTEGRLDRMNVREFYLRDELDLRGELRRPDPDTLELELSGPFLNAAPLLDGLIGASGQGGTLPLFGNVSLSADIDRLRLRNDIEATDASLDIAFIGPVMQSLDVSGVMDLDNQFSLSVTANGNGESALSANASNAGSVMSAFLGQEFMSGGAFTMNGTLRSSGQPSDVRIVLTNTRLNNAPLLTQVLSLASLRGLADVMSGDGILFSQVTLPLILDERGYYIEGAQASGPALGLTANGYILDDGEDLLVNGVLVPSFGVNSALGGIPIIGDLFVSRDGEGVFAITYDIRGSLESARVAVNPLSGIVPGVLRRIFENPDTDAPELPPPAEAEGD
ncbi:DUF3971 domain-containing protein [Ponticaulis sp.]|uniref:YhdP family protein n=1 Tax=Ponticaulis sp. TaxID=2020902 RepID=UPI000B66EB60|nr:DUF3971 domain-containing protein [Ponticaulis sp.]MAI89544.1 hypothetical protein [Ponticaulis sp.]OUY00575.1 MAG: hypothetical protein CBB65_03820 [Hyphomonadaceae bacterium TMED5]